MLVNMRRRTLLLTARATVDFARHASALCCR
jgi:hypothetical protein